MQNAKFKMQTPSDASLMGEQRCDSSRQIGIAAVFAFFILNLALRVSST
jgi:hypothetical protein